MDWTTVMIIALAILLVGLASGMRIFVALALTGIIVIWVTIGLKQEILIGFSTWRTFNSYALAAIPMFVFMGELIFRSGVSGKAYNALSPTLDHLPGGLLHSNVVAGTVFAACSGSSVASAATIGRLALPEMEARGYSKGLAMGSIASGGSLGNLIPPSIHFIIYGIMTRQSIGKLFIAGIIPGIMMAVLYMTYIAIRVRIRPQMAPKGKAIPWKNSFMKLLGVWPIFVLAIVVLGSIYGGIATPTEAAGAGVLGAIIIGLGYRSLSWQTLKESTLGALRTTGFTILILLGAQILGVLLTNIGALSEMTRWVVSLPLSPLAILVAILLMYIILGCFMSGLPVVVVTLPMTFPVIMSLGYNPIWFGVVIELLIEAGLLTPPVGVNLYVLRGLRPKYPFGEIVRGMIPFFLLICLGIIIITVFPALATWLPSIMIGN